MQSTLIIKQMEDYDYILKEQLGMQAFLLFSSTYGIRL
jgi:hypothetical protein